jgi:CubicO group peptidase (beta-lactamase class C family)
MQSSGNPAPENCPEMKIIRLPSKKKPVRVKELEPLRAMIKGFVDRGDTRYIELLLTKAGKVVFWETYGKTNGVSDTAVKKDVICNIASSTKPLSATCLMILDDEEKIKLDDPVSKYLPAFGHMRATDANKASPSPTVRQLLSHTSGLAGFGK